MAGGVHPDRVLLPAPGLSRGGWCSSSPPGFFWVLLAFILAFILVFFWCSITQKNTRRTQKNPEERQKNTPEEKPPPCPFPLSALPAAAADGSTASGQRDDLRQRQEHSHPARRRGSLQQDDGPDGGYFYFGGALRRISPRQKVPIPTTRERGRRADEKQIEYKSLRMRRELATTPAWVLSRGIEMAKTENRKPMRMRMRSPPSPSPEHLVCPGTLPGGASRGKA